MALSWAAGAVDGWRRRRVAAPTTFYSANHHQCKVENRVDRTTPSTLFFYKVPIVTTLFQLIVRIKITPCADESFSYKKMSWVFK